MERRGFTILELLVVLTLLVVVTGLVMPSVMGRMAGSVLDAAISRIEGAAALCRAEAQQRGLPVRMVARADGRGTVSIYAETVELERGDDNPGRGSGHGARGGGRLLDPDLESDERLDERMGRAGARAERFRNIPICTLPDGYRLSAEPPAERFDSFRDPGAPGDAGSTGEGAFADPELVDARTFDGPDAGDLIRPMQLALYLPDGSAIVASPLYLIVGEGEGERGFTVALSRFSGGCEIKPAPVEREGLFGREPPSENAPTASGRGAARGPGGGRDG